MLLYSFTSYAKSFFFIYLNVSDVTSNIHNVVVLAPNTCVSYEVFRKVNLPNNNYSQTPHLPTNVRANICQMFLF